MADSQTWNEVDQKDSRKPLLLGSRIALFLALAFFSTLPVLVKLFAAPQNRTLVLTGHPGELTVMEMGGRYYVDIEALTRVANGSISFKGNQMVLSLSPPTAVYGHLREPLGTTCRVAAVTLDGIGHNELAPRAQRSAASRTISLKVWLLSSCSGPASFGGCQGC